MTRPIDRRAFLATTGAAALATALPNALPADEPDRLTIVDTHTHFYDPTRPEGVPWPPKGSPLYRTVLPKHYRAERTPTPVTGTVVVEASERVEDNQWILDLAKEDPFIVGFVGRLPLLEDRFAVLVDRFAENELFRGIRIRSADVAAALEDSKIEKRLTLLADRDLSIDLLGNRAPLENVQTLAKRIPKLRIVIDHMANPVLTGERSNAVVEWERRMSPLGPHENVYCKVSGLVEAASRGRKTGESPKDVAFYAPTLDHLWKVFGEDRVVYGSNWPVCERGGSLFTVQKIVTDYFSTKGDVALRKYFAGNAKSVYKWVTRSA